MRQPKYQSAKMTHSITMLCYCADCPYAEFAILFTIKLNVVVLNLVMLSVVGPSQMPKVGGLNVFHTVECRDISRNAECSCTECFILSVIFILMLSLVVLSAMTPY